MSRTFAYVRVSTAEQNFENQIKEIEAAGFTIEPHRIITDIVSGSMPTVRRKGFTRLLVSFLKVEFSELSKSSSVI